MSFRPMGVATSNFATLNNEIQDYYRQARFEEDSGGGYGSDEDDGPYWKVALQTAQDNKIKEVEYEDIEYENNGEYGYYADPCYPAYPVERSSTHIAEAREKASRLPSKTPPKQKFEGVFPPPCKNQFRPGQNLPPKQVAPQPAPVPPPQPVQPPVQSTSKLTPLAPRNQQPIDARRPRATEDVEMRDVRPIPPKPHNSPHTQPRNHPPHVTTKEVPEKAHAPA